VEGDNRHMGRMKESSSWSMRIGLPNHKRCETRVKLSNAVFDYTEAYDNRLRCPSQLDS